MVWNLACEIEELHLVGLEVRPEMVEWFPIHLQRHLRDG